MPPKAWHNIHGWLSLEEGRVLQELCHDKGVLEIGSYKGRSSVCIADVANFIDCVDHFKMGVNGRLNRQESEDLFSEFIENTITFSNLNLYLESFREYSEFSTPKSYDVVYYDLGKSRTNIQMFLDWLIEHTYKGVLVIHNYQVHKEITKQVDKFRKTVVPNQEGKVIWFNEKQMIRILLNQGGDS